MCKPTPPLRIAQVATADSSVRALLSGQIRGLQRRGAHVTAICAPGPEVAALRHSGIPIETVPMRRRPAPPQDIASLWGLWRTLRSGRFDAVITHTPKAGILGPPAGRLARVPAVIHTVHGLLFHDQMPPGRARLFRAVESWTAWWAQWLFFQSREDLATARDLRLAPTNRLYHVGNGIDLNRFRPGRRHQGIGAAASPFPSEPGTLRDELGLAPDHLVVGMVARLVREKGLGEFLDAAEMLLPHFPQMRFLVVGPTEPERSDGIPERRLRTLAATGRFIFAGEQNDMPAVYRCMDIFVLPSHREGIPRAVMEAGAMGLPVVATNIRGCRETVRDGVTGLLVPVRSAAAVAEAVARIARNGSGNAMGAAGRALVQAEFDEELVLDRIADALAEILRRPLRDSSWEY